MRDIRDSFIRAYIISHDPDLGDNRRYYEEALKGDRANLRASDMFSLTGDIDPVAVSQNLTCEIERIMGIFPNLPEITTDPETGLPDGTPIYDICEIPPNTN